MGTAQHFMKRASALSLFAYALALTACAVPSQYMGIGFAPAAASTELQGLAMGAQAGHKQAQLDFGIQYEEGHGVATDLRKARKLYRLASADTGGTTCVYVPGTRKGEAGDAC